MDKRLDASTPVLFKILLLLLIGLWGHLGIFRAQATSPLPPARTGDSCSVSSTLTKTETLQYSITTPGFVFSPQGPIYKVTGTAPSSITRCLQTPGAWNVKAPLATALYGIGVASDGVYVYSVGGTISANSGSVSNQLVRYDPRANTWSSLAPLPTPVFDAAVIYAEGKLYTFGGMINAVSTTNLLQIYDIGPGNWSYGSPMPAPRQQMGAGHYNGKIYIVGGIQSDSIADAKNTTWEYTITGGTWATKAPIFTGVGGAASGVVNGHLYILGGREPSSAVINTVYDYNINENTWITATTMPTLVNYPGSAVYAGRIWVFGGGNPFLANSAQTPESTATYNITQIYDPISNSFQIGPNQNVTRSFQGGAVVENLIISVGGYNSTTGKSSNVVEVSEQEPLKIIILHADGSDTPPTTLQGQLLNLPGVDLVDIFNAEQGTPSLTVLQAYDVVVTFSKNNWFNSTDLGNVLADYQDSGGVVVAFNYSLSASWGTDGRWISGGYSPFDLADGMINITSTLGAYSYGHPLMAGITTLSSYNRQDLALSAGAQPVANWADGEFLIATKGRAVGVNAYVGDQVGGWQGDFARLIVNAGYWLMQGTCTDLTCNDTNVIQGSLSVEDTVSIGRLNFRELASICPTPLACPGTSGTNAIHYDAFPFANNTNQSQCIKVSLDPRSCTGTTFLQSSAYLGSYNPASQCANYLADIGASPAGVKSYSFTVPAWQSYTVVVNEANANSYCPAYTLIVTASDCPIKHIFLPEIVH